MLSAGLQPNLVTYNTLLEVYAKRGMWREAVGVLDTLEQQVCLTKRNCLCVCFGNPAFCWVPTSKARHVNDMRKLQYAADTLLSIGIG
jgi:pentatricopeptide repeat protein